MIKNVEKKRFEKTKGRKLEQLECSVAPLLQIEDVSNA